MRLLVPFVLLLAAFASPPPSELRLRAHVVSSSQIELSWEDGVGPDENRAFAVERSLVATSGFTEIASTTQKIYTDTGLFPATTYFYRIRSATGPASQTYSGVVGATTPFGLLLPAPPVLRLPATSNQKIEGRIVRLGNKMVSLYSSGKRAERWLSVRDEACREFTALLPGIHATSTFRAEYSMMREDELWVFSSDTPAFGAKGTAPVMRKYVLSGRPTVARLQESMALSNEAAGVGDFISLQSGALLGVWYRPNMGFTGDPQSNWMDLGFAYRNPEGFWWTIFPVRVKGLPNHEHRIAAVQHPSDNSVWVFSKGDSFAQITALRLVENAGKITLTHTLPNFISQQADGMNGPESELPDLAAVADPWRKSIFLAYQNAKFQIFSTQPKFAKGAWISVAEISPEGSRSFSVLPIYVERISSLGLLALPDRLILGFRPIDERTFTHEHLYRSSLASGSWSFPVYLGTSSSHPQNMVNTANSCPYTR